LEITKELKHAIFVLNDYAVVKREVTLIKEDSRIVSRKNNDKTYNPDSDLPLSDSKLKLICDIHFTDTIKNTWMKLDDSEKNNYR
tara:strand:+ start:121 stop:375 length:255 start_codon:yes stop_codon:yes gene_type:complete